MSTTFLSAEVHALSAKVNQLTAEVAGLRAENARLAAELELCGNRSRVRAVVDGVDVDAGEAAEVAVIAEAATCEGEDGELDE
jgi:hypothetical protein